MDHARNDDDICDPTVIARCRELLGDEAAGLSDRDVERVRRHAETMANVVVEMFLEHRDAQE